MNKLNSQCRNKGTACVIAYICCYIASFGCWTLIIICCSKSTDVTHCFRKWKNMGLYEECSCVKFFAFLEWRYWTWQSFLLNSRIERCNTRNKICIPYSFLVMIYVWGCLKNNIWLNNADTNDLCAHFISVIHWQHISNIIFYFYWVIISKYYRSSVVSFKCFNT